MTDRFTHGYDGKRNKGYRVGTLWCSKTDIEGDVTLSLNFDELDNISKVDLLQEMIGLLEREKQHIISDPEYWRK
jgi:hypothetical protein